MKLLGFFCDHENKYLSYLIQQLHSLPPLFSIIEAQKSSTSTHAVDDKNAECDANASDSEGMS